MDDIWTIPTTWRFQAAGRAGRRFHLMTMVVGMLKMLWVKRPNGAQTVPEVKPGIAGWKKNEFFLNKMQTCQWF